MGMVECRDGARLTLEAGALVGVVGNLGPKDFDGDAAIEPCIACLVDFAHPARAERRDDFVRPEAGAGDEGHRNWRELYAARPREG
jgi:hypothetical protein